MSYQATDWVFEHSATEHGTRLVLLVIAKHADKEGRKSWPSVETISREARLSTREVQRAIKKLRAGDEVGIIDNGGPHGTHAFCLTKMSPHKNVTPDKNAARGVTIMSNHDTKMSPESSFLNLPLNHPDPTAKILMREKRRNAERDDFIRRHERAR